MNFEESSMMLRQHAGAGKDIKDYTVIEYFTLLKVLEKQNRQRKELNKWLNNDKL